MADDGGVLGNLPRSRPGQRSEKRPDDVEAETAPKSRPRKATGAKPKRAPKAKVKTGSRAKAGPKAKTKAAKSRAAKPKAAPKPKGAPKPPAAEVPPADVRPPRDNAERESDAVGDVLRTAGKVAGTGIRVAAGLTEEVLRRVRRR